MSAFECTAIEGIGVHRKVGVAQRAKVQLEGMNPAPRPFLAQTAAARHTTELAYLTPPKSSESHVVASL